MAVGDGEEGLYVVFSLSHLSPAFCVLGFGYVLSLAVFLAEIFVKWIAMDGTVKWRMFQSDGTVNRKQRRCLHVATEKMCEFKRQEYFDSKCKK
jgi:hypothetical protein